MESEIALEKLYQFYNLASVNDLALKMNISRQTITNWKARNSINAIKKKCRELGIYNDIFGDTTVTEQYTLGSDSVGKVTGGIGIQTNKQDLYFYNEFQKIEQLANMGKGLEELKIKLENLKEELKKDI